MSSPAYRTTNNKQPFLFLLNPLNNLTRALSKSIPINIRRRNAIQFKDRRYTSKGARRLGHAMMDLDVGVLGVDAGVEVIICGYQSDIPG